MHTVKTAAKRLCICPGIIYDLVTSGALPHYRLGKHGRRGAIRIDEADLEAYLAAQKREKEPDAPTAPQHESHPSLVESDESVAGAHIV